MCDSCTESDLESYTSVPPEDVGRHHRSLNYYGNPQDYDIDPRSLSYRSSIDLNTSSSGSSSCDITNEIEGNSKPHKAHDSGWEAIRAIKLRDGTMGLSHFRILQRLGSGDIGTVYLVELRETSYYFAMKVMDKKSLASRNKLLRAQTEREILEALDHPFLPTLYTYLNERHFSSLVMEFCPGGDLHILRQRQPSKRFGENAVRFYAAEVLLALEYLHMMGIVYRDLKPENVLVREDGHIMLSDFDLSLKCNVNPILWRLASVRRPSSAGTSCNLPGFGCVAPCNVHPIASCLPFSLPRAFQLPGCALKPSPRTARRPLPELIVEPTNVRSMSFVGTHEYLAPEVILADGHGSAVDWWTLGIFLFELLYGTTPFKGADNELTLTNIITQPLRFPSNHDEHYFVSPAAQHLVRGLLIKDPLKRLAALRGASEIKQQPFFQGINWALIRCAVPPEIPGPIGSFTDQGEPPLSHNDKKELNSIVDGSADSDLELF